MTLRKYLWLWALPLALLCYAIGSSQGVIALVLVAVVGELIFWLGLFKRCKRRDNAPKP